MAVSPKESLRPTVFGVVLDSEGLGGGLLSGEGFLVGVWEGGDGGWVLEVVNFFWLAGVQFFSFLRFSNFC